MTVAAEMRARVEGTLSPTDAGGIYRAMIQPRIEARVNKGKFSLKIPVSELPEGREVIGNLVQYLRSQEMGFNAWTTVDYSNSAGPRPKRKLVIEW
jgi:hypothetical protein